MSHSVRYLAVAGDISGLGLPTCRLCKWMQQSKLDFLTLVFGAPACSTASGPPHNSGRCVQAFREKHYG